MKGANREVGVGLVATIARALSDLLAQSPGQIPLSMELSFSFEDGSSARTSLPLAPPATAVTGKDQPKEQTAPPPDTGPDVPAQIPSNRLIEIEHNGLIAMGAPRAKVLNA